MKKERVMLEWRHFVGLRGNKRTSNKEESNPETALIESVVKQYWQEGFANSIPERTTPGITYCFYTEYSGDHTGKYAFSIGEETNRSNVPESGILIAAPKGPYLKFTTDPGPMPQVIIQAWQKIWEMERSGTLGAKRTYQTDFERYDERSKDPQNTVVEIYLGIEE